MFFNKKYNPESFMNAFKELSLKAGFDLQAQVVLWCEDGVTPVSERKGKSFQKKLTLLLKSEGVTMMPTFKVIKNNVPANNSK